MSMIVFVYSSKNSQDTVKESLPRLRRKNSEKQTAVNPNEEITAPTITNEYARVSLSPYTLHFPCDVH